MVEMYSMAGKNESGRSVARADPDFDHYALWDLIESPSAASEWVPLRLTAGEGRLTDLPACDVLGRICSPKLVDAISKVTSIVTWLPVEIRNADGLHNHAFMHFPEIVPIADYRKSTTAAGRVVNPYVIESAIAPISLMVLEPLSSSVVITSEVKRSIEEAGCEGLDFQRLSSG